MIPYQFDLGVKVLQFNVMPNLHVLELHLQMLIRLEVLEAVGALKDRVVQSLTQGRLIEVQFLGHLLVPGDIEGGVGVLQEWLVGFFTYLRHFDSWSFLCLRLHLSQFFLEILVCLE